MLLFNHIRGWLPFNGKYLIIFHAAFIEMNTKGKTTEDDIVL